MSVLTETEREALTEAITRALAEHEFRAGYDDEDWCSCGRSYTVASYHEHRAHLGTVFAALLVEREAALVDRVGELIESHRIVNPMNGDGSNHMLDKVEATLLNEFGSALTRGILRSAEAARTRAAEQAERLRQMNSPEERAKRRAALPPDATGSTS